MSNNDDLDVLSEKNKTANVKIIMYAMQTDGWLYLWQRLDELHYSNVSLQYWTPDKYIFLGISQSEF